MTREQAYGQVCAWFAEGRLRVLVGENYTDWTASTPPRWEAFQRDHNKQRFCRREDEPQMPDEVFLTPSESWLKHVRSAFLDKDACAKLAGKPVRYVRAGAAIHAVRVEYRNGGDWYPVSVAGQEYRIKP